MARDRKSAVPVGYSDKRPLKTADRKTIDRVDVIDNLIDGVYIINPEGYFTYMNQTLADRCGMARETYCTTHFTELIDPAYREIARSNFERTKRGEAGVPYELISQSAANGIRVVEVHSRPVFENGNLVGVVGISRDITKRKEMEKAVQKSEHRYRSLLENAGDAILLANKDGMLLEVNRKALELLGYSRQEILRMNIDALHPREWTDRIADIFENVAKRGSCVITETLALRKDGTTVPIEITGSQIEYDGGVIVQGIFRDVTERKKAEQERWENQERLRLALQAGRQGYYDWNIPDDDMYYSDQYLELLGYERADFKPRIGSWKKLLHPDDRQGVFRALKNHLDGATSHYEATYRLKVKSGSWRWFRGRAEVVNRDESGRPLRLMGTITDVTSYKELEQDLEKRVAARTAELVELNAALKVLLKHRETIKVDTEETITANLKFMVLPYLQKLKKSGLQGQQKTWVSVIDENLDKIASPFIRNLSSKYAVLTPKEIQIADQIRLGKSSKEIAEMMNLSPRSVDVFRYSLRKKLGVNKKKANLQSLLSSL